MIDTQIQSSQSQKKLYHLIPWHPRSMFISYDSSVHDIHAFLIILDILEHIIGQNMKNITLQTRIKREYNTRFRVFLTELRVGVTFPVPTLRLAYYGRIHDGRKQVFRNSLKEMGKNPQRRSGNQVFSQNFFLLIMRFHL